MTFLTAVWGMIQSVHVTFPTLWNWHFFLWMGLEIDTFWQSLDLGEVFPFSDDLWCLFASACSPGRLYCLDPEWKIVLRWNTFLGYLNFHSATFQRVGGWQRDAAMLEIWPHWNFQRELLPVLKTKISGHLRLRESSGVSLLACSVPFSSPILIFKKKNKPRPRVIFTWNQESEEGTLELRSELCGEASCSWCVSVPEDCEPVPFLHLEMEPLSSHLGEEILCYPGVNRHPHIRVSILSIFKIFYILKCPSLSLCHQWPSSIHSEWKSGDCQYFPWSSLHLPWCGCPLSPLSISLSWMESRGHRVVLRQPCVTPWSSFCFWFS